MADTPYVLDFAEIALKDLASVGVKNASLGEMFRALKPKGVDWLVPQNASHDHEHDEHCADACVARRLRWRPEA